MSNITILLILLIYIVTHYKQMLYVSLYILSHTKHCKISLTRTDCGKDILNSET